MKPSSKTSYLLVLLMLLPNLVQTSRSQAPKKPYLKPRIPPPKRQPDVPFDPHSMRQLITNITITSEGLLAEDTAIPGEGIGANSNGTCSLCQGAELLSDHAPIYEPSDASLPPNLTCGELEQMAQTQISSGEPCETSGIRLFYPQCCQSHVPVYTCERNIRQALLSDENNRYDSAVPPVLSHKEPLNITVRLDYHTVVSLDVQEGTSEIYASLTLHWKDPRLTWQMDAEHCAGFITAFASMDSEKTELWVPDLDLYNQIEGVQNFPDVMAVIYNDGTVVWNRIGGLKAFCQFTGISQIPFDVIGCQLLVGPWVRVNPLQIRYLLENGTGLYYGSFEPTYNEYLPVPELAESGHSHGGNLLWFNIFFRRSTQYYIFNLIVPTIILTYVSMGTFLLDLRVGERLSYGMALALVVVAQQIATGGMIPVSNERLWIDKLIGWSFYWVVVGLLESVFVGYLYFLREDMQANASKEEEKRTFIYDGMPNSELYSVSASAATRNGDESKNKTAEQPSPPNGKASVDVDEVHQSIEARDKKTISFSSEEEHVPEPKPSTESLTFKQQLQTSNSQSQQSNNRPRQTQLQRTRTLRLNQTDSEDCKISKKWKWMYTISLRKLDRFSFFFALVTYTLFLIAMFISIPFWGQKEDIVWVDETVEH